MVAFQCLPILQQPRLPRAVTAPVDLAAIRLRLPDVRCRAAPAAARLRRVSVLVSSADRSQSAAAAAAATHRTSPGENVVLPTCPTPEDLRLLQNGSDVRGVATQIPPEFTREVTLTGAHAYLLGRAFAQWVAATVVTDPADISLSIGRDSRITGPEIAASVAAGMASAGVTNIVDFGLATTPAMFMSTITTDWDFTAAVMITASHLPPDRNGLKFFTKEGGTRKSEVSEIIELAGAAIEALGGQASYPWFDDEKAAKIAKHSDFMSVYSAQLRTLIIKGCDHPTRRDKPLDGLHIVVDAGNGGGGFFATQVLEPLGADTSGSQFLNPDGMFPNHVPNPEDPTAMKMTIKATTENKADLGIVFDTDVDRSAVVDSRGTGINRNKLIALLSSVVLQEHPGSTILTDSVTSNGLAKFIEGLGGKHFRYRRGYKNVIDKGVELNVDGEECWLAIETSGHGAMRENYFLDDGAYLAVKVVIELVRVSLEGRENGISAVLEALEEPLAENEIRIKFRDPSNPEFKRLASSVLEDFAEFAIEQTGWELEGENYEGYRVRVQEGNGKEGWLLLRKSLHDPLLPLNIESETSGGVEAIQAIVKGFIGRYDFLDQTAFL